MYRTPVANRLIFSDRLLYLLLVLFVFFITRIAAAQICLGLMAAIWVWQLLTGRRVFGSIKLPAPALPLFLLVTQSVVSAIFSADPFFCLNNMKGQANLLAIILFCDLLRGENDLLPLADSISLMGGLVALVGIAQYLFSGAGGVQNRISGPMSHYMTYSGLLMLIDILLIARVVLLPRLGLPWGKQESGCGRWLLWLSLVLVNVALVMTYSRHAWVGLIAGIAVIAWYLKSWRLVILPLALISILVLTPGTLSKRIQDIFDTRTNVSNIDRINLVKSGLRMAADHPLTGVGPGMVQELYPAYRTRWAVKPRNCHLHNTPVQICAEVGVPGLILWLWFILRLFVDFNRAIPGKDRYSSVLPVNNFSEKRFLFFQLGPLAALTAFLISGLFEYNFGDSEVVLLFLLIISLAYSAAGKKQALLVDSPTESGVAGS